MTYDDELTWDSICSGDLTGVFHLGTSGAQHIVRMTRPRTIMELANALALNRPGAHDALGRYVGGLMGQNGYSHTDALAQTYGTLLYQEQLTRLLHIHASMSMAEAELTCRLYRKNKLVDLSDIEHVERVLGYPSFGAVSF